MSVCDSLGFNASEEVWWVGRLCIVLSYLFLLFDVSEIYIHGWVGLIR